LDKAPDAFRTISEVADELDVPQHVLRFWESRFPQIKPMKRAGGRRYYRPDDVDLLRGIRHLLYGEGYTIRGVQRILREQGPKFVQAVWQPGATQPTTEPGEETPDDAERLAPDEAARTLFGLLKAPPAPTREPDPVTAASEREPAVSSSVPRLTHEHVRRLQSALHELRECRQLIEQALKDEAA
jgi:DNA-binding transcriptional MerR regulator